MIAHPVIGAQAPLKLPPGVFNGKTLHKVTQNLMAKGGMQFFAGEAGLYVSHNIKSWNAMGAIWKDCLLLTNQRIIKVEDRKIKNTHMLGNMAAARRLKLGIFKWDKIEITLLNGHKATVGVADDGVCQFFTKQLQGIIAHRPAMHRPAMVAPIMVAPAMVAPVVVHAPAMGHMPPPGMAPMGAVAQGMRPMGAPGMAPMGAAPGMVPMGAAPGMGAPMGQACVRCGTPRGPGVMFCRSCGTPF